MQKIKSVEVKVVYTELIEGLGYYCSQPGESPFVCLSETLLAGSEQTHKEVYTVLLEHHRSILLDSIFRSFLILKYYEDLVKEAEPEEPEISIIGRAIRHRDFVFYEFVQPAPEARVIGR